MNSIIAVLIRAHPRNPRQGIALSRSRAITGSPDLLCVSLCLLWLKVLICVSSALICGERFPDSCLIQGAARLAHPGGGPTSWLFLPLPGCARNALQSNWMRPWSAVRLVMAFSPNCEWDAVYVRCIRRVPDPFALLENDLQILCLSLTLPKVCAQRSGVP